MVSESRKRLLAVLAHPDDESFGMGGTLALYAQQGVEVHLICATRGEAGDIPAEIMRPEGDVADLREEELRCAASHLGLEEVHFLNYRDSGMAGSEDNKHPQSLAAAPLDQVAAKVTHLIRKLRPQVVLTFDPFGGYGHPDHIAIQRAAEQAFHAAGDPQRYPDGLPPYQPQKLYYHIFPRRFLSLAVRLMPLFGKNPRRWGRNEDIDLTEVVERSYPVHAEVDFASVAERKERASACHSSQAGPSSGGLIGLFLRRWGSRESFTRAHPPVSDGAKERDLFAGIEVEA